MIPQSPQNPQLPHKLLIATKNKGKLAEIQTLFLDFPIKILSLDDVKITDEVEETGQTFAENALIKAKAYAKLSGILTLADDSGLEVDALEGRPGIYSARYAPGSDADRVKKVLEEVKNIPDEKRTARFHAAVVLYDPATEKYRLFEGTTEGKITTEPKGSHGFGYDPIFYSFDLKKPFGEASEGEKNTISHRGKALQKLKDYLFSFSSS